MQTPDTLVYSKDASVATILPTELMQAQPAGRDIYAESKVLT